MAFHNASEGIQGFGEQLKNYFTIEVQNYATSGRSARSFWHEGRFANLTNNISPGDYVVIEFGHNDGGSPTNCNATSPPACVRPDTPGTGNATTTVTMPDGSKQVVQTYMTYMRWYIEGVLAKGGYPLVCSQTPNGYKDWNANHTVVGNGMIYRNYSATIAAQTNQRYLDHYKYIANAYENLGYSKTWPALFGNAASGVNPSDDTHSSNTGSIVVAKAFLNGLLCISSSLTKYLNADGVAASKGLKCTYVAPTKASRKIRRFV